MTIEVAAYIPELDQSEPPGSDQVSEGSGHIRTVKTAVTGSFPAFVGTTAVPKFIILTEDEINDLPQRSIPESIAQQWDFLAGLLSAGVLVADIDDVQLVQDAVDALQILVQRPASRSLGVTGPLIQADQGETVLFAGAGGDNLEIEQLLIGTEITVRHRGGGDMNVVEGAGVTLNWLDGGGAGAPTGNRVVSRSSVIELYWATATTVEVWGNGIT